MNRSLRLLGICPVAMMLSAACTEPPPPTPDARADVANMLNDSASDTGVIENDVPELDATMEDRRTPPSDQGVPQCRSGESRNCYSGAAGTAGIGRCRVGAETCSAAGEWGACAGEITPAASEQCGNAIDDDCDGMVDEGCGVCMPGAMRACYSGAMTTQGVGQCRAGTQTCDPTGNWPMACPGEVLAAPMEVCGNTIDDNCNGMSDEGCGACTMGMTRACYSGPMMTQGIGRCRGGSQTCDASGNWPSMCEGEVVPDAMERCGNREDDDCDGMVDEGCGTCTPGVTRACYSGSAATAGVGICRRGTQTCDGTGNYPMPCAGEVLPMAAEQCGNGLDDDCDGMAEEGCGACTPGAMRSCYSGPAGSAGTGRCRAGTQTCDGTRNWPMTCAGEILPSSSEACGNGVDDDCDGMVDEGCSVLASSMESNWYHTCVVRSDTGVSCWGQNNSGELGDGTTADAFAPVRVVGLTGVSRVGVGVNHSCALRTDGTVWCWGSNIYGQIGDGTTTRRPAPTRVPTITNAIALGVGFSHSCAVLMGGALRCWGRNNTGQLGDGTTTDRFVPVAVAGIANVVEVAANGVTTGSTTCARSMDGTVRCWGENGDGQVGDNTTIDRLTPTVAMGLSNAASLALGTRTTCAVRTDNTLWCWGSNGLGPYGNGTTASSRVPVAVSGMTGVAQVRLGSGHGCGVMTDCRVLCWGANGHGELGDGTTVVSRPTPAAVIPAINDGAGVALGYYHSCARRRDGSIRCWGDNFYGQIGDGVSTRVSAPTAVPGITNAVEIRAGGNTTCARLVDNTVRCWGSNSLGAVGDGSMDDRVGSPRTVSGLSGVAQLAMGEGHSCARLSTNALRCWGSNTFGELGNGSTTFSRTPVAVSSIATATELSLGAAHSCARLTDNTARCWGYNLYGQIGDGLTVNRSVPTIVSGLSTTASVGLGSYHSCAVMNDRTARCWGYNASGQLGDGSTTNRPASVVVSGLSMVAQLEGGLSFSCSRHMDATIRCWGANFSGQLGDGTSTGRTTPTLVTGVAGATQLAAGSDFVLTRMTDGTVRSWGGNFYGQQADGTTATRRVPATVSGLSNVLSVAAGTGHGCALATDGTVRCWGGNYYGQVGNGVVGLRTSPAAVSL